ncbi:MAG: hypothetical protein D6815_00525 [Candidatus Dadabacteria bacterium]|nr:MAG: hypothetical protein D6815_00525 [Candidatus Dadabacteria bacterium]
MTKAFTLAHTARGLVRQLAILAAGLAFSLPAAIQAGAVTPTLLDEGTSLSDVSSPVIDDTGAVYWLSHQSELHSSLAGILASDPRTVAEAGDWPLLGDIADSRRGTILLLGTLMVPRPPPLGGFGHLGAVYLYPGLVRVLYYGSDIPGFPTPVEPGDLRMGWPEFDSDGTIVFAPLDTSDFHAIHYAIARATAAGSVTVLVESGVTPVPGTAGVPFTLVSDPVVSRGIVLFYGEAASIGRRGVYQLSGGSLSAVVDNTTVLPGESTPAPILSKRSVDYAADGADVVVAIREKPRSGVFKRVGGTWTRVAGAGDPIPGGAGDFLDFAEPAIRDGVVVFKGGRNNQFLPPLEDGFFTDARGTLEAIVTLTDDFGSHHPNSLGGARGGRYFNGSGIAFRATEGFAWVGAYRIAVPGLETARCGRPVGGGATPRASDALFVLKAAVGAASCAPCVCDVDGSGGSAPVTASDALRVLKKAVGQSVSFSCAKC